MNKQVTEEIKEVQIINEPATPHLSTVLLPFDCDDNDLAILWDGGKPVGLVIDRRLQEQLFRAMKLWRRPFMPHRLFGNTCASCGRIIDDRAKSCMLCHPGAKGHDREAED